MIFMYEDPALDWDAFYEAQEAADARKLHCDICGCTLNDKYYEIDGDNLCEECMEEGHLRHVDY